MRTPSLPVSEFRAWVEANPKLVTRTESKRYPGLFVFKYKKRVFYDALWNKYLEWARGLVLDADWNIVVQPFRKIYNRFERDTDFPLGEEVVAYRKVNGFMAAMTWHPTTERLIISTTGSLDSDFVTMAEEILFQKSDRHGVIEFFKDGGYPHTTWLFEIVHTKDPHIVNEDVGAYSLAFTVPVYTDDGILNDLEASHFMTYSDHAMCNVLGYREVQPHYIKFEEVVTRAAKCQHEGYVVYDRDSNPYAALKIKSPYYLVTKFFARKGEAKLRTILESDQWSQMVDEEFYELVSHLRQNKDQFVAMGERDRIGFVRQWFVDTLDNTN